MPNLGRPLDLSNRIDAFEGREALSKGDAAGPALQRCRGVENAGDSVLTAGEEPALEMWIDVECRDLSRVFLHLYVLQWFGCSRPDAGDVVGEDLAVGACRKDGRVAVPFHVANAELVSCRIPLWARGLRSNDGPQVDSLVEVEVEALRVVEHHRLEDMCAAQDGGPAIGRDIEAEYRNASSVDTVLRL